MKAAVCSGSCSGPNLLLFSACWQRPRRRRTMGKKSLIYSGGISGIISSRKCLDCELGFSGHNGNRHNLLLFSVFWNRPYCRCAKCKKSLIFFGVWKIFLFVCLFVLPGLKAAVCNGSSSGPNLRLFNATGAPYAQNP